MTVEENIERGRKAIKEILQTHGEVKGAMTRTEIGAIDFLWGQEGTDEKKHKDGYGISKILLKHGEETVNVIPEVIARGTYEQVDGRSDRRYFIYKGYRAVVRLTWDGKEKTWLVTNFLDKKIKNPDDADAFVRSASTDGGTISPSQQDSSTAPSIPQEQQEVTQKDYDFGDIEENVAEIAIGE